MSEQAKRDKQDAIDAVVGGDLPRLEAALKRLSGSDPADFARITRDLLNTDQREQYAIVGFASMPDVFHADGKVYGAVYTNGDFLCKRAHQSGAGLPFAEVRSVVESVRQAFDQSVLDRVVALKEHIEQIEGVLTGHSFSDSRLANLAFTDLTKGQALMIAAITK
ncbi:hypothetical protein [Pseudomonas guariconensis]|uniref:Uncharacterized protein n=1 Tax=Pseudomonas guariconensis TaxID=1288410 RepID=A0AAX0VQD7_9PSED|nr:hypothetical protein [Pseudomonas guariconensis]PLV12883.1 hypothetical protein CXG49_25020 [Pseudomonas guariconensis]PLV20954.1 hypothetical protein CXG53_25110 [Pseudomonas guariconensis]PLV26583.1 hypothetical protein CXG51_25115 [Pseudomonas guariconensis]